VICWFNFSVNSKFSNYPAVGLSDVTLSMLELNGVSMHSHQLNQAKMLHL